MRFAAQLLQRQFRRQLLAFLLAVALSFASLHSFERHTVDEHGRSGLVLLFENRLEVDAHTVLLAPFDELALEVHLLISNLVDVYHLCQYSFAHELHASVVSSVEVDGSDERFEGVASHV